MTSGYYVIITEADFSKCLFTSHIFTARVLLDLDKLSPTSVARAASSVDRVPIVAEFFSAAFG